MIQWFVLSLSVRGGLSILQLRAFGFLPPCRVLTRGDGYHFSLFVSSFRSVTRQAFHGQWQLRLLSPGLARPGALGEVVHSGPSHSISQLVGVFSWGFLVRLQILPAFR